MTAKRSPAGELSPRIERSGVAPPSNLLSEWARLLLDGFAAAGVERVVISPGSRSTPFVAAADAHPLLDCHDVVDERSAAFFALGQAKVSGRPSLLLCTSGTAGAHYLPAVIEARRSHTPLLILTADRPFELMDCAAPQTVDQTRLFGHHARFVELGEPRESERALRALRRKAVQATWLAAGAEPGAVHLNARAAKPLEPVAAEAAEAAGLALAKRVDRLIASPVPRPIGPFGAVPAHRLAPLAEACRRAARGLIVCGPGALDQAGARRAIFGLAAALGYPLCAEASSQLRYAPAPEGVLRIGALDALAESDLFDREPPELVLQLGAPPTSGAWGRRIAAQPPPLAVLAAHDWNDPESIARWLVFADPGAAASALGEALKAAGPPTDDAVRRAWRERLRAADELAWRAADEVLEEAGGELSEGEVARRLVAALPEGALLALGNSLPIRLVDRWAPPAETTLGVLSQRGANGIDGLVSGAAGAASRLPAGVPTALLLGDVSLLHDLAGLAVARSLRRPLILVVINNDGGRIFEQLPIAGAVGDEMLEHWITPHGLGFAPAAQTFGLPYHRATNAAELERALAEAREHLGATLIEAVVPPSGARRLDRALADACARRFESLGETSGNEEAR